MSKRYLVGQETLQMAHRSVEGELFGRIDSQDTKADFSIVGRDLSVDNTQHKNPDTYTPTQIEKFYIKYPNWMRK